MTLYNLPETDVEHERWCYWDNAFTENKIEDIKHICSKLTLENSTVSGELTPKEAKKSRNNKVAWIPIGPENDFIYLTIANVISKINSQFYQFDLSGIGELIQYSEYHVGEHYKAWHTDNMDKIQTYSMPRKLSLTMELSKPERYCQKVDTFSSNYGRMIVFPSYTLHRVKTVTKGVRKSLVVWVAGPKFK